MAITYIRLKHFTRFFLNRISEFELNIKSNILVIIGKNGSGKSSFLEQLSPWPPHKSCFLESGEKETHHEHNNKNYILKAVFSPSARYYFEVDGVVLNNWGTLTTQKELVTEHFGITQTIYNLSLSNERFHDMSTMRRKEWFVQLCDTDYTYGIEVYNRAKEKHRDIAGSIKTIAKRLNAETEKIIKEEQEKELAEQVKELHDCLNVLLENRIPVQKELSIIDDEISEHRRKLNSEIKQYKLIYSKIYKNESYDYATLEKIIDKFSSKIIATNTLLSNYSKENDEVSKKLNALKLIENQTISDLQHKIMTLDFQLNKKIESSMFFDESFLAHTAKTTYLEHIKFKLIDIIINVPNNSEGIYSREKLDKSRLRLSELRHKKDKLIRESSAILEKLNHYETHKDKNDAECPRCKFVFNLLLSQDNLKSLKERNETVLKSIKDCDEKISQEEEYINQTNNYIVNYRSFLNIIESSPILNQYWKLIMRDNMFKNNPEGIVHFLTDLEKDLDVQIQISDLQNKLKEERRNLSSIKDANIQNSDIGYLTDRQNYLVQEIENKTNRVVWLTDRRSSFSQLLSLKKNLDKIISSIELISKTYKNATEEKIETIRRNTYNNVVKTMQTLLAKKVSVLHQAHAQKEIIRVLSEQLEGLEKELKAWELLSKILSPTEGIVAEGLTGFMNIFIEKINKIIASTWTYEMIIEPCVFEDNSIDLNYKFPVTIGDTIKLRPKDISETSKGQKEIIDLAFLITAMSSFNSGKHALVLDEIGSNFDDEHKDTLSLVLSSLIDQRAFEQIFMVSHDYKQYDALNAQCIKLSSPEEELHGKYNSGLKITRM